MQGWREKWEELNERLVEAQGEEWKWVMAECERREKPLLQMESKL